MSLSQMPVFDRAMLKRHLRQAEEHIATGEKNIARQWELIAKLERDNHDTAHARAILDQFEELQEMHLADRERILRELSEESKYRTCREADMSGFKRHGLFASGSNTT